MKIPETFLPEKKLDNKVEELIKEKPLQKPQINKKGYAIPDYAVQENGDYLMVLHAILINTLDCKKLTSSNFHFTTEGEEHELFIGGEVIKLDGRFVKVEEGLICKLIDLVELGSSYEPDYDSSDWRLSVKHATENAYKELVKFDHNL